MNNVIGVYCIFDVKSKRMNAPIFLVNDEVAKRGVLASMSSDIVLSKFPEDFILYRLGDFSERDGLSVYDEKVVVCSLSDLAKEIYNEIS